MMANATRTSPEGHHSRPRGFWSALLAASMLVFGGQVMVLCCHSDGSSALESRMFGRCEPAAGSRGTKATEAGFTSEDNSCGDCTDVPVIVTSARSAAPRDAGGTLRHLVTAATSALSESRQQATPQRAEGGPSILTPPNHRLASLRAVILLV